MRFIHVIIIFCSNRALKYQQILDMFEKIEGIDYIYSSGLMIHKRNKWLKIAKWLQKIIKRT